MPRLHVPRKIVAERIISDFAWDENKRDVEKIKTLVNGKAKIISKIERPIAVQNSDVDFVF